MGDLDVRRALELRAQMARDKEGTNVFLRGADASIERHSDELFGHDATPDLSPLDARYVAPRKVLMEWVGEPSPFDSPLVRALRLRGELSRFHVLMLKEIALIRSPRIDRVTARVLGPREGLSKQYRWGKMPGTFTVEVDFVDVDRILAIGKSGLDRSINQFRILGKYSDAMPQFVPDEAWAKVIREMSRRQGLPGLSPGADRLRINAGPEERLVLVNKQGTYGHFKS